MNIVKHGGVRRIVRQQAGRISNTALHFVLLAAMGLPMIGCEDKKEKKIKELEDKVHTLDGEIEDLKKESARLQENSDRLKELERARERKAAELKDLQSK